MKWDFLKMNEYDLISVLKIYIHHILSIITSLLCLLVAITPGISSLMRVLIFPLPRFTEDKLIISVSYLIIKPGQVRLYGVTSGLDLNKPNLEWMNPWEISKWYRSVLAHFL